MKQFTNIFALVLFLAAVCCGVSRAQVAAGTHIDNTAGLRFTYLSGAPDSLHASAETVIVDSLAAPSMRIEKSVSRTEAYAGDTLVYVIRIVNTGIVPLTNVTVRDTIDAQSLVLLGASANASCTSNIVTYTKASLGAGEEDSVIVRAGILPLVSAGRTVVNTAHAGASSVSPQEASASTRVAEKIVPFSSMTFTKEASRDSVASGDTLSYTLVVSSTGTAALTQAAVSDTLPAFFTNASVHTTPYAHAAVMNGIMTYRRDTLAAGQTDTIVVTGVAVFAQELFSRAIVNTAYAQAKETARQEAEAAVYTKQPPVARLNVTKAASASRATAGDTLVYVIRIGNAGNVALTALTVRDTIPFQLEDSRLINSPHAALAGRVMTYARARLEIGETDSVTIASRISAGRPNTENIVNTVHAGSDQTPVQIAQAAAVIEAATPSGSPLRVQKTVSKGRVYIGDTLSYMLKVVNTGSSALMNVEVCDTIPYQVINVRPNGSASVRGHIVTRTIPVLLPGASDTMSVTGTLWLNAFNTEIILNRAFAWAPGGDTLTADADFVAVADPTCRLELHAEPGRIIGNGREKAVIEALLTNTFGIPKPDGTPVYLSTTAGTFSNGRDTMTIFTRSGKAVDSLRAVVAGNRIIEAFAVARADDGQGCHSTDTVKIMFYPGAIEGVVRDQRTGVPVSGAMVRAYSQTTDSLAGFQETAEDGYYLIPVAKTDSFRVVITVNDVFGKTDSVASNIFVVVTGSGNPPLPNKNSVTGTIFYIASGRPVPIHGMPVFLNAQTSNALSARSLQPAHMNAAIDSTVTDSTGAYHFGDIPAGTYEVRLRHKEIDGSLTFTNKGRGECLVNANIAVTLNPNILLKKTGPSRAYVNTVAKYEITAGNNGTLSTTNTVLIDSLDRLMKFVAASPGGVYDTLAHRVTWAVGRMDSSASKIFWVTVSFPDTLGANTPSWNRAVIYSDQTTRIADSVRTDVMGVPRLRIWKTASAEAAGSGDPLRYTIRVVNLQGATAYDITVVDSLPRQVQFVDASSVPAPRSQSYDSTAHRVIWTIDSLAAAAATHDTLTLTVSAKVRDDLKPGEYRYNNLARAHFEGGPDVYSDLDTLSHAWVKTTVSYLKITKRALRRLIDIGDIAAYAVDVTNISPVSVARSVTISDRIPFGFRYMSGSTTIGGVKVMDPSGTKLLQWTLADSLGPNQTVQCVYRLVAGAGAAEGDGINTAQAFGRTETGLAMSSAIVSERVEVRRGVFTDHGLIIGKVFYDNDQNRYQDSSDTGVKGIELMMEDGTRITTGDDGKYSVPDVNPGEHVVRVRRQSLPANTELLAGYSDFAGDAASRFVTVTEAGIARADFYLKRMEQVTPDTADAFKETVMTGEASVQRIADPSDSAFIEDERFASMNLSGVNFAVGKASLQPAAFPILAEAGALMKEYADQTVIIAGHTDSMRIHTNEFPDNTALSYARAREVKRHLIRTFTIDSARISVIGFGENRPIASNKTVEGRARNRRIEFILNGTVEAPKRLTQTVVFTIPVSYHGSVPVRRIEIHDILDDSLHVVDGSGRLNGQPLPARRDGQHVYWTLDSIGQSFSGEITYQAQFGRPAAGVAVMKSRSIVTYIAGDSTIVCRDTLEVTNRAAVAVRGAAVNYNLAGALFDVGKASLRSSAASALQTAGEALRDDATSIAVIEGHTDSRPIHTAEFPSNVELSKARANTVLDHLSKTYGIDRSRLHAAGYGSLRPVSDNAGAEGRQANRRVEVRISRKSFTDAQVKEGSVDSSAVSTMRFKQTVRQSARLKQQQAGPLVIEAMKQQH